ncbi:MAG: hypothetical protein ABI977_18750 [Acidobacteriota bacterium]
MNRVNDNPAEREMVSYYLGEMSEAELARFEIRYLADDSLFEQMLMVKQELIDAYVRQHLDAATREKFERHFLATLEGQKEVAFARALREKLNESTLLPVESRKFNLREWLSVRSWRELAFAGTVALLLAGGSWLWNQNRKLRAELFDLQTRHAEQTRNNGELQRQLAELRLPNSSPSPSPAPSFIPPPNEAPQQSFDLLAINLAGKARSPAEATPGPIEITLPAGDYRPALTVRLGFKPVGMRCDVALQTPDGTVHQRRNARAYQQYGIFLRATFPRAKLKAGDYKVTIQGRDAEDGADKTASYYFRLKP